MKMVVLILTAILAIVVGVLLLPKHMPSVKPTTSGLTNSASSAVEYKNNEIPFTFSYPRDWFQQTVQQKEGSYIIYFFVNGITPVYGEDGSTKGNAVFQILYGKDTRTLDEVKSLYKSINWSYKEIVIAGKDGIQDQFGLIFLKPSSDTSMAFQRGSTPEMQKSRQAIMGSLSFNQ